MYGRVSSCRGAGLLSTLGGVAGAAINRTIDILPTELHLPGGYQWCGPGTNVKQRLARGDGGINKLDAACKIHDLAYEKYKDSERRALADKELAERAWERVKASDSSLGEKSAAWLVTNIMKAKSKIGGGSVKRNQRKKKTKRKQVKRKQVKRKTVNNKRKNTNNRKKGKGLYLKPYKGSGCSKKKNNLLITNH